jgi:acyl transferase domain-containing protein
MTAITKVFGDAEGDQNAVGEPWCAIGSVKSMIGHTQAASGIAGLIKAALALHHKVLPATLNVVKPNTQIDWSRSPCYINTKSKPWLAQPDEDRAHPRRAAVSAFGFGGINAHVILEEHCPSASEPAPQAVPLKAANKSQSHSIRLALKFPTLNAKSLQGLQLSPAPSSASETPLKTNIIKQSSQRSNALTETSVPQARLIAVPSKATAESNVGATQGGDSQVLCTFVQTMNSVHEQMLDVQENVMLAYLKNNKPTARK